MNDEDFKHGSESPPSPSTPVFETVSGGQGASSARELRQMKRDVIRSKQAAGGNNTTASVTSDRGASAQRQKFDVLDPSAIYQTHRENIDQSPNLHSQPLMQEVEPSTSEFSLEDDGIDVPTSSSLKDHLVHKTRASNQSDYEQEAKPRINFPKSGDIAAWKAIDGELSVALPKVFSKHLINSPSTSTSELSKKFDDWLHAFFLQRCGTVPETNRTVPRKKEFRHRGLERLRQKKRLLTKAFKVLVKAGYEDSQLGRIAKDEWKKLLRQHNSLRRSVLQWNKKRAEVAASRDFKRDPNRFASKLFTSSSSAKPTFSREQATDYFSKTYRDEQREEIFIPLDSFNRPPEPSVIFEEECPSLRQLNISVRKKSNKASAGMNGLSYVPYKRCPSIMLTLHFIVKRIWVTKDIPEDWAQAFVVLLSKSDILNDPSEFRPIAITNTVGKIFFSVISDRLQKFLVQNNYLRRETQKGFLSGLPGCLEHSFTLFEALRDAKENQRQIIVTWIDLANAYGSVRHNLIQFALNWYHVPDSIQKLIFDYYNKLMAKVQTSEWSTGFFLFDIGLFQGCVLSTILFDAVFQLLLDMLKPVDEKLGYSFKNIAYKSLTRAYADDLALSASTPAKMQRACNICDKFLEWTKTMRAKPRKCVAVGYRQFDKRSDKGKYKKHRNVKYAPFDPGIIIGGKRMRFIFDEDKSDDATVTLLRDHFKFLGRWISIDLNELKIQSFIRARFLKEVEIIESSNVTGFMKLWLYQHYLLSHLAWPFLIHDLPLSFARSLESAITMKLKKWARLYRGADTGALFRSRDLFGLGLTSASHHFIKMQLIKCSLLENSEDEHVRASFKHKHIKTSAWTVKWDARRLYKSFSADVILQTQFPTQASRLGLGNGVFNGNPSKADIRRMLVNTTNSVEEDKLFAHSVQLERQGDWTAWSGKVNPFDFSWKNLIYGPGDSLISFVLNATINTCRTPVLMKLWGYLAKASCVLCTGDHCTLHHILANCQVALNQRRYNWRHDSVLLELKSFLGEHLVQHAKRKKISKNIKFVKKGTFSKSRSSVDRSSSILDSAKDWELLVDLDDNRSLFPPEVYATAQRPDIILFSRLSHQIILAELTNGAEEGFVNAKLRKEGRYASLVANINDDEANPWTALLFTIEVGARGFVGYSLTSFLKKIGATRRASRSTCKRISLISAKCSYGIYLMHANINWDAKRPLLELPNKEGKSG